MKLNESSYNSFQNCRVFKGLDGLRFFSIISVIWHHSIGQLDYFPATGLGFLGVDLFFVISGFLIVSLLIREKQICGDISLKSFYIRRCLRIFPLYYGYLLALSLFYLLLNTDSILGETIVQELPIYLFYLANFFPVSLSILWSLASEEQFYLVWPFLEKHIKRHIGLVICLLLIVNQAINFQRTAIAEWLDLPQIAQLSIMQTTFTPILLGVGLAHILHNKKLFGFFNTVLVGKHSSSIFLIMLFAICSIPIADISGLPRLTIHIVMMLLVGSVVLNNDSILSVLLNSPIAARIGVISYGMYLFHLHAISLADKLIGVAGLDSKFGLFIVSLAIVIVIAEFSYRYFETPFLKVKAKYSNVQQHHR